MNWRSDVETPLNLSISSMVTSEAFLAEISPSSRIILNFVGSKYPKKSVFNFEKKLH